MLDNFLVGFYYLVKKQRRRKHLGFVAELCPICCEITAAKISKSFTCSGKDMLDEQAHGDVRYYAACTRCSYEEETSDRRYAKVCHLKKQIKRLIQLTQPNINTKRRNNLKIYETIRSGKLTGDSEENIKSHFLSTAEECKKARQRRLHRNNYRKKLGSFLISIPFFGFFIFLVSRNNLEDALGFLIFLILYMIFFPVFLMKKSPSYVKGIFRTQIRKLREQTACFPELDKELAEKQTVKN